MRSSAGRRRVGSAAAQAAQAVGGASGAGQAAGVGQAAGAEAAGGRRRRVVGGSGAEALTIEAGAARR